MLNRPKRTRGCERPFSQPQLTATSGQLVFTALTYIMFGVCVDSPEVAIPVVIYSIPVIFLLASWAYCVSVDPAEPVRTVCKFDTPTISVSLLLDCRHKCCCLVGKHERCKIDTVACATKLYQVSITTASG